MMYRDLLNFSENNETKSHNKEVNKCR